jgi:hypothetical protein
MTTAMKSRDYELLTRGIFQQLLNQECIPNILVEHDCVKQGIKTGHQIDVYWEFKLGGITYRNVVQAKNWAKRIDKSAVLKLEAVLRLTQLRFETTAPLSRPYLNFKFSLTS